MTTGELIKKRRKQIGMSAEELADKINVSASTIYRYEKGDIEKVPGSLLEPIANALHTDAYFLMGWKEAPEDTGTDEQRLITLYSSCNQTGKEMIMTVAEMAADKYPAP